MRLGELARRLGAELRGDPEVEIRAVASLDRAGPGDLSFVSNPKYGKLLDTTEASAVIVGPGAPRGDRNSLVSGNPYLCYARAVTLLHPEERMSAGISDRAHVHPEARVGEGAAVMAGATVEAGAVVGEGTVLHPGVYVGPGAEVGRDCVLHANAVVRERCVLGDRVILQPGVVVGSDGFGYAREGERYVKIPQVGIAVLEDDVEVGAGTTIDRAALGETRVGRGTKIDNLVMIAHNVQIGESCLLVSQVGISGSTRVGNGVVLAGQVGLVGHITIGDGATVGAQSGVSADVPPGVTISGSPAFDHREWLKAQAVFRRLPELRETVRDLGKRLSRLEGGDARPGDNVEED